MLQITNNSETGKVIYDIMIDGAECKDVMLTKDAMTRFTLEAGTVYVALRPQGQTYYGLTLPLAIRSGEISYLNYYDNLGDPGTTAPYTATVRYLGDDTVVDTFDFNLPGILTIDTGRTGKIIKSVESPQLNGGEPVLIGRNGNDTVNLNFTANGELRYRAADVGGYTPIGSYAEFQLLNTYGYAPVSKYKQEADLDLLGSIDGGQTWTGQRWEPIRNNTPDILGRFYPATSFYGEYDGAGYAIGGLWVDDPYPGRSFYQGLFGSVADSILTNIRIKSGFVQGYSGDYTAGVVAFADSGTTIFNCSNNARVAGHMHTGGVVGFLLEDQHGFNFGSTIRGCSNSGAVSASGYSNIGGVVGRLIGTDMVGCYNTGAVNGSSSVGGVVGKSEESCISSCYNTGAVNGKTSVGGVAGSVSGTTIENSYWLYNSDASAGSAVGNSTDEGCTKFGDGSGGTSWPTDNAAAGWGVGNSPYDGQSWKILGGWVDGGAPDGVNSTFPKLYWE
jgi:hypothetical protein